MVKRATPSIDYNIAEYWDTVQVKSGFATGAVTGTIEIPANSFVKECIAQVVKKPITTGSVVFEVGDVNDTDGLLTEQQMTEASGTIFGNDRDDFGDYLRLYETYIRESRTQPEWQHIGKWFANAGQVVVTVTVASVAPTVDGSLRVWVKIVRLDTKED